MGFTLTSKAAQLYAHSPYEVLRTVSILNLPAAIAIFEKFSTWHSTHLGQGTYDGFVTGLALQLVEPVLKNLRVSRAQFIKRHGHAHIGL
jgi:hypothetical protein